MLYAFVLHLDADREERPWPDHPHGFLRGWLQRDFDPATMADLHDRAGPKPASLAVLPESTPQRLSVRLTALSDELGEAMVSRLAALQSSGDAVRLGRTTGRLAAATFQPEHHPLAGVAEWRDLLALPPTWHWAFRFHTPTSFSHGRPHPRLPDPFSLWRSWQDRWQAADAPFKPERAALDRIDDQVFWLDHALTLDQIWSADEGRLKPRVGFVGGAAFAAEEAQLPAEAAWALTVLAAFSFWAGTGWQPLQGMGLTEWLPEPRGCDAERWTGRQG